MRTLVFILLTVLIVSSCEEFVTTQHSGPEFVFQDGIDYLPADGKSWTVITLVFDPLLSSEQNVVIATTAGVLFELPLDGFDNGKKELVVIPNSRKYKFVLLSSSEPDSSVLISVKLNNILSERIFRFDRVCPDELLFDLSAPEISISLGDRGEAMVNALSKGGPVSNGTRIEISLNTDTLATVEPRVLLSGTEQKISIVPLGRIGELQITATINQDGCETIPSITRKLIVNQ